MLYVTAGLIVTALAAGALASTQEESNRFVDDLLTQRLRAESGRFQLEEVPLDDFKFKIKKELELGILPTHRDIKANFTNGVLVGLTNLRRKGNCNPTAYLTGAITLVCPLDLANTEARYTSFVKGFNIVGQVKEIQVKTKITEAIVNFEIKEKQDQKPFVSTFVLNRILTQVDFPDIGFNEERNAKFRDEVEKAVHPMMFTTITGKLMDAINAALKQDGVKLPPV